MTNRKVRDTVFCHFMSTEAHLLALCNALNGTKYDESTDIIININQDTCARVLCILRWISLSASKSVTPTTLSVFSANQMISVPLPAITNAS